MTGRLGICTPTRSSSKAKRRGAPRRAADSGTLSSSTTVTWCRVPAIGAPTTALTSRWYVGACRYYNSNQNKLELETNVEENKTRVTPLTLPNILIEVG